ncbi:MAG: phosphoglucomutase [Chloroflexota bacterium]|nr:MAG: phosphoglucomutase [Chloroflexota bacterium]
MGQRPHLRTVRWEGVFGAEFTLAAVRERCRALASTLASHRWSCLAAYDTRFMASQYALDAYRLLEAGGVSVSIAAAAAPMPAIELALSQRKADCALVVSAANRPYWFAGLIVLAPLSGPALQDLFERPAPMLDLDTSPFPPPPEIGQSGQVDLRGPYIDSLREAVDIELIRRSPLTIFVDAMNGTASGCIPAVLGEGAQAKAIEINRETDALFGRQTPQPTEVGLQRLRKLVRESESHLGVAISADGRAIAVADHTGELVPPLDLALLLAQYLSGQHRQRGLVVAPASGPEPEGWLKAWEEASGVRVELSSDPAARIAEVVERDRSSLLVGITPNGEVTLGRYSPSADGTLSALVLAEAVARYGEKLRTLVEQAKGRP